MKIKRENEIISIIKSCGYYASVEYIAERLSLSASTVRRDLQSMEKDGKIKRSYSGVEYLGKEELLAPFPLRTHKNLEQKMAVCRLAASFVKEGFTVFTDASSTAYCLANYLKDFENVKVVTNGMETLNALSVSKLEVFSTGGKISSSNRVALVGNRAVDIINSVHADVAFVSAFGVSKDGGVYDVYDDEIAVRQAMFKNADKKILMLDEMKFGKSAPFKLANLTDFDAVLCNKKIENFFLPEVEVNITAY